MAKLKAQKVPQKKEKKPQLKKPKVGELFTSRNRTLFAIGIVVMLIGYITLGMGSITLAPILLVAAYCVIIPIAIVARGKKRPQKLGTKKKAEAS